MRICYGSDAAALKFAFFGYSRTGWDDNTQMSDHLCELVLREGNASPEDAESDC